MSKRKKRKKIQLPQDIGEPRKLRVASSCQKQRRIAGQKVAEGFVYSDAQTPVWSFRLCDMEKSCRWSFAPEIIGSDFLSKVVPKLQALEGMTWGEILTGESSKKKHHPISIGSLSREARHRLSQLHQEHWGEIYALHIDSTHVLYGFLNGRVFYLLWYDPAHGNQKTCVCPSTLKHT